jgi:predicted transcriptional regulator of viral defense system
MNAYDIIFDEAIGNYGLFRSSKAKSLGISGSAILGLAKRGRLIRMSHGLYRIDKYVPRPDGLDAYAIAVARVGEDAYLWGPSVLQIYRLCPTDPAKIYVATPTRYRGRLPKGIILKNGAKAVGVGVVEGIRVQSVGKAILSCQHMLMFNRLLDAVAAAREQGLMNEVEAHCTLREMYKND